MPEEKIQTLHPQASKTNKKIAASKYHYIKEHLIQVLQGKTLTHTELI